MRPAFIHFKFVPQGDNFTFKDVHLVQKLKNGRYSFTVNVQIPMQANRFFKIREGAFFNKFPLLHPHDLDKPNLINGTDKIGIYPVAAAKGLYGNKVCVFHPNVVLLIPQSVLSLFGSSAWVFLSYR